MNIQGNLAEDIECIRKLAKESENKNGQTQASHLPVWPELIRGVPNIFLRSALFAAIQGKTRRFIYNRELGGPGGTVVRFTGQQLDQSDLDVWEQAVHLARPHALGTVVYFRVSRFLEAMGRDNGRTQYEWLNESIERLACCFVEIRDGAMSFSGSLLSKCDRDEKTSIYRLTLDADTRKFYGENNWTGIEWKQRQKLRGKPLALWLHGFYSSYAEPVPIRVESLRELSGSTNKDEYDFKRKLKAAFADLRRASGMNAGIDGDLVTMKPRPSHAKIVHLIAA